MYQPFFNLVKLLILKHATNLSFEVLISENRNYPGPVICSISQKKRSAPEFQKMWANYDILGREAPKFLEFDNLLLIFPVRSRFFAFAM